MSDKISVVYDAEIRDLKGKLDELITKNKDLATAAGTAQAKLSGLNSSVSATNNAFNQSTTVINNYNNSVNTTNNSINNMNNSLNNTRGQLGLLDGFLSRIASRIAAVFAIDSIIGFGKSIVDVTRKTELLQNRLNFVFENTENGRAAFDRLYETSQKLGIGFEDLLSGFSGFGIAARAAGFSAKTTETIFVKVATSLRAAGASSLQTQRAFYALQQMLSKGVVAAEELRRQLGEALPGASDKMTKAYNRLHPAQQLSNREFTKLLEDGKVISAEILPEFANVLEEDFAPALSGKQNSLDATLTRAGNAFERFKLQIGQTNFEQISGTFKWLEGRLNNINTLLKNSKGFWQSYSNVVNEFLLGGSEGSSGIKGLFGRWWSDRVKNEQEMQELNERDFQNRSMQMAKGVGQQKELNQMTKKELEDRQKALQVEIDTNKITSQSTDKEKELGRVRLRALGFVIEQLQVVAEKENQNLQAQSQAESTKQEQRRKLLKALEEEMEKRKKLYEDSLKDEKSSREDQLKLQKDYVEAYVNYEVKQQEALENEKAAIRLKKEREVNLEILNMDLAALEKQLIEYKQYGQDTTYVEKQIKDKKIEILKLTARTQQEIGLGIAQFDEKERQKKSERETAALEKELNAFIAAQEQKISQTKDGSDERLRLQNELLDKEEEYEKRIVDASILLTDEKESKKLEITAKYAVKRRKLNEKDEKQEENHAEKIRKILQESQDLIERSEGDSFRKRIARTKQMFEKMARDIKDAMSKTQDFEVLGELTKALGEVEAAGKKATDSIELEQVTEIIGGVGNVYSEIAKMQSVAYDNEEIALKRQLEQKLISEQEYERKAAELAKRRFEHEKKTATISAIIDGALGVMKAIGKGRWWEIAAISAATGIQIATIQSQQFPGFKEGVIDLQGPGTATSDSIPARLSRGESVMTAEETTKYKPVLQAIRDNEFEAFVAKRYTDVMRRQSGNAGLGGSFAENVSNSFDMQTAELATLLKQNRRVAIKNVDEFAKAISRRSTTDKVINRRRFK